MTLITVGCWFAFITRAWFQPDCPSADCVRPAEPASPRTEQPRLHLHRQPAAFQSMSIRRPKPARELSASSYPVSIPAPAGLPRGLRNHRSTALYDPGRRPIRRFDIRRRSLTGPLAAVDVVDFPVNTSSEAPLVRMVRGTGLFGLIGWGLLRLIELGFLEVAAYSASRRRGRGGSCPVVSAGSAVLEAHTGGIRFNGVAWTYSASSSIIRPRRTLPPRPQSHHFLYIRSATSRLIGGRLARS